MSKGVSSKFHKSVMDRQLPIPYTLTEILRMSNAILGFRVAWMLALEKTAFPLIQSQL